MGRISLEHLSAAIRKVQAMSLPQKAGLTEEIFAHQPNLLAAVLVQHRLGVSYAKMDVLIDILLVCYRAMKETGLTWSLISENDQEYQMTRSTAIIQSFEKLDADSQTQFTGQYIDEFPEKELLAFVTNEVRLWLARLDREPNQNENDKYVMMAAANLVNCIAYASTRSA
jgi:hypothetical protein